MAPHLGEIDRVYLWLSWFRVLAVVGFGGWKSQETRWTATKVPAGTAILGATTTDVMAFSGVVVEERSISLQLATQIINTLN